MNKLSKINFPPVFYNTEVTNDHLTEYTKESLYKKCGKNYLFKQRCLVQVFINIFLDNYIY